MHGTERMFGVEASERLRRAMIQKFCRFGLQELDWASFSHPGPPDFFLALFGLALGSSRTRTARAVVADRRGSFAAPFWRLPLATGTLPRPNLAPRCRQLASVSSDLFILLWKITMHRTERIFGVVGVEASERLRRALIRNFWRVGLQEFDLASFARPGPPESF
jgi:hypothetical protein